MVKRLALIGLIVGVSVTHVPDARASQVTPSDCVKVEYIEGIWANMDSTRIAYLVKAPNLEKNRNDYGLYVKDIADQSSSPGKLLLSGVEVSDLRWLDNGTHIGMLELIGGTKRFSIVDVETGATSLPFEVDKDIDAYTTDASGNTVVYSVSDAPEGSSAHPESASRPMESGYRVEPAKTVTDGYQTRSVFMRHRNAKGEWSSPQTITIENPFTHRKTTHLEYGRHLSLSPDGHTLFLTYITDGIPNAWLKNPYIKYVASMHSALEIMMFYDMRDGSSRLAFKNIICYSDPIWSPDSQSIFFNTHSPIGSSWESADIRDRHISPKDVNLFQVEADSGAVTEVIRHVSPLFDDEGPLAVTPDGHVATRTGESSVGLYRRVGNHWEHESVTSLPTKIGDKFAFLASGRNVIVGVHETVTTPENLFLYRRGEAQIDVMTDLNPQLATVHFAPVRPVEWTTKEGMTVDGLLFVPSDYRPGMRYPLVIQTKTDSGWFTCDSGASHYPSFAPQPIASAGIMYLVRTLRSNWDYQEDLDKRPNGYPGGIDEPEQQMGIWESAVEMLDKRGLIDPSRVGIIGFSRTGYQVEFDLVHSSVKYAAATAADNVQYSLGEYWLFPEIAKEEERMYGGPPYGKGLDNWKRFSISFNLPAIHTPLLMEEMGYGVHESTEDLVPRDLAAHEEVFQGLQRLGKPVEMYYYPNEVHQLDHPKARLASLERNLDWYRFWLQGYEDPDPSKAVQYDHWRSMRTLRDNDASDTAPTAVEPH